MVYLFSQRGRDYDYNGGDTQRGAAEMKRHVMINKRILIMLMAFVMAFTGVFTITSAGTYAEDQGPVHLLMVDNQSVNQRVVKHFSKVGVEVTTVYDINQVDPALYDGLVIPGGNNIDPRVYHAKRSKKTYGTDINKDWLQIEAVKRFAAAGKPVLGLCRGCQVINVAFGGTIKQHIRWHKGFRKVRNVKGYWMYRMYGKTRKTYHYHHQCVARLGSGLVATSYDSRSRHIESIQHRKLPVYGIQWHPDCKVGRQGYRVFESFRDICLVYRNR